MMAAGNRLAVDTPYCRSRREHKESTERLSS
jgi:hypothetical protein